MRLMRFIISGRFTIFLVAVISGLYLFETLGSEESWQRMVILIKENLFFKAVITLFYVHLFLKGVYRVSRGKMRHFASSIILVSLSLVISGMYFSILLRDTERHRYNISEQTGRGLNIADIRMYNLSLLRNILSNCFYLKKY